LQSDASHSTLSISVKKSCAETLWQCYLYSIVEVTAIALNDVGNNYILVERKEVVSLQKTKTTGNLIIVTNFNDIHRPSLISTSVEFPAVILHQIWNGFKSNEINCIVGTDSP